MVLRILPDRAPAGPYRSSGAGIGVIARALSALIDAGAHTRRGDSVGDIAEAAGVSVNTVRAQVRWVQEKTGCRRQAEVVGLLGGIAVAPA